MNIWNELGFRENPYSTRPVPADDNGVRLLVGRERELKSLLKYIRNADTHPTLEGPNGVGKTSLVSVAGYILKRDFENKISSQALLPIREPFQFLPGDTTAAFKLRVFLKVANAFLDYNEILSSSGYKVPLVEDIKAWLNPATNSVISDSAVGLNYHGQLANLNIRNDAGFISAVSRWLLECFPNRSLGGFICSIDNLELLATSKSARTLLEEIRDEVLIVPGLRWVLCGARGIMRASASSSRMQGVLSDPTNINPIGHDFIKSLIGARLEVFACRADAVAPVEVQGFDHIYRVTNNNLRIAMKHSEDFAIWASDQEIHLLDSTEKFALLETWFSNEADLYLEDTSGVGPTAWQVFDRLAEKGGNMSPSEYADFDFESNQAMRPHIRMLEEANLVESAIDETDDRRKTISITARGWIVKYKRKNSAKTSCG